MQWRCCNGFVETVLLQQYSLPPFTFVYKHLLQWYPLPLSLLLQWYPLPLSFVAVVFTPPFHVCLQTFIAVVCIPPFHFGLQTFVAVVSTPHFTFVAVVFTPPFHFCLQTFVAVVFTTPFHFCCSGIHCPLSLLFTIICCSGIHSPFHFFCSGIRSPLSLLFTTEPPFFMTTGYAIKYRPVFLGFQASENSALVLGTFSYWLPGNKYGEKIISISTIQGSSITNLKSRGLASLLSMVYIELKPRLQSKRIKKNGKLAD